MEINKQTLIKTYSSIINSVALCINYDDKGAKMLVQSILSEAKLYGIEKDELDIKGALREIGMS